MVLAPASQQVADRRRWNDEGDAGLAKVVHAGRRLTREAEHAANHNADDVAASVERRTAANAACGGQRWIIRNNVFRRNGGRMPGCDIDWEDGLEYM